MRERPILFSAPMVRALLAGTKTQTRRAVKWNKPAPGLNLGFSGLEAHRFDGGTWWALASRRGDSCWEERTEPTRCPYGQPGDRLWVREAFMHEPADYCWEASVSIPCRPATTVYRADHDGDTHGAGWKPSIHMPRALSRIMLQITGVRVDRLQDISEADAKTEGVDEAQMPMGCMYSTAQVLRTRYREGYAALWESINGPGSWDANPWVWVVSFKRVT